MFSWFERNHKISLLIAFALAVFIFYISSRTFPPSQFALNIESLIYHIGIFFLLELFLLFALVRGKRKDLIFIVVVIAVLYGVSDEIHQFFVPGRYMTPFDIMQNSIGVISAAIFYILILKKTKNI